MNPELIAGLVAVTVAITVLAKKMLEIIQASIEAKRNGGKSKGASTIILEHKDREEREAVVAVILKAGPKLDDLHEWFGPDGPYSKLHREIADE